MQQCIAWIAAPRLAPSDVARGTTGVLKTSATKNYGFDRLYDEVCKRWVYLNSKNELVNLKDKYEVIKNNFNETQREKNNIFKQIKELNNSLTKTNIVGTPYVKEKVKEVNINSEVLNEITENNLENEKKSFKEDNNLDKEIEDIFS